MTTTNETTQTTPSSETPPPAGTETPAATGTETPSTSNETPSISASTDLGNEEAAAATAGATTDLGADDEVKEEGEAAEDPYKDFRGPPENGSYADFTLPDGAVADEELKNEFVPLVTELGLSQAGAQKLVDFKTKLDAAHVKRWGDHLNELREAAKNDPEIGKAKYTENLSIAKKAIAKFGGPGLRDVLNKYGVGAHAEMIRAWAKVGRAMGETPGLDNGGGSGTVQKPLHELMYGDSSAKT